MVVFSSKVVSMPHIGRYLAPHPLYDQKDWAALLYYPSHGISSIHTGAVYVFQGLLYMWIQIGKKT